MTVPGLAGLDDWLLAHGEELTAFRRHLHAHPELSGQEHETTDHLAERLAVAGIESRRLSSGTGLICDLAPGTRPTVVLRADIDALAMEDEKDVPYRSTRPGVAHACGHDVHTAVVLGAGLALRALAGGQQVNVRLLFQPAEERLPGGALTAIADGAMQDARAIFAVHCDPKLDAGRIGLRVGPITSATDVVSVRVKGPGGHTARPERTADVVAITASVVRDLEDEVERRLGGRPINIVFGSVHAGHAPNVIPSRAELQGTVRTPDSEVWEEVPGMVSEALAALVEPRGATFDLDYVRGHPPVVNDLWATSLVEQAAQEVLDDGAVRPTGQSVGGDDFSWYLEHAPGCYVRLGVGDPSTADPPMDLHASCFDVDERCIPVGVRLLVASTLAVLAQS